MPIHPSTLFFSSKSGFVARPSDFASTDFDRVADSSPAALADLAKSAKTWGKPPRNGTIGRGVKTRYCVIGSITRQLLGRIKRQRGVWRYWMATKKGQVVSVTDTGDLVTDIPVADLEAPRDDSLRIQCEGHVTQGLFASTEGHPEMTLIAFENASGFVQIAITSGDASGFLSIKPGAEVTLSW